MALPTRSQPPHSAILILAVASANLGLSLLSPVITDLRQDLFANADEAQLVLSSFMISVAAGQLISGSLSDKFGRRYVLITGSVIFGVGGVGAMLATNIEMLIVLRIVQGAGAAACMTMGRVIVNDSFEGAEAARKMSVISSAQAIVPLLGFGFGGVIAEFIGWRGSIAIMVFGAILIGVLSSLYVAETRRGVPVPLRLASLTTAYLSLIKSPGVRYHGLTSGFAIAIFFTMGGTMPYEFSRLGVSAMEFGALFAVTSVGYVTGNAINRSLVGRIGLRRMALAGSLLTLLVPGSMLAGHLFDLLTPARLSFLCFCFGICNGLVIANSMICSMRAAGENSGAGTGLLGAIQMFLGAVLGSIIIAFGGATDFVVTSSGLLIIALLGATSSFLGSKV